MKLLMVSSVRILLEYGLCNESRMQVETGFIAVKGMIALSQENQNVNIT